MHCSYYALLRARDGEGDLVAQPWMDDLNAVELADIGTDWKEALFRQIAIPRPLEADDPTVLLSIDIDHNFRRPPGTEKA